MRDNTFILPDHAQEGKRAKSVERSQFMLDEDALDLGKGKTYFIRTYGCAANVRDGETIAGLLEAMGFQRAADEKSADVLIFNTCAVRGTSEEHVFGEIGTLKPWKQQHPEKILALCGCMAQEESVV
ncbi:MAG: tRNA (N6-isopentenyl adenosine(37)-C2)-methylthiotransferase MiaB, partial [Galactobacillus timonensis]|nr:tRNA (N6-isopentenyl adenosine(37)-C2)-methylthiotransferase MiaB [Galactobacillus timonensis]